MCHSYDDHYTGMITNCPNFADCNCPTANDLPGGACSDSYDDITCVQQPDTSGRTWTWHNNPTSTKYFLVAGGLMLLSCLGWCCFNQLATKMERSPAASSQRLLAAPAPAPASSTQRQAQARSAAQRQAGRVSQDPWRYFECASPRVTARLAYTGFVERPGCRTSTSRAHEQDFQRCVPAGWRRGWMALLQER
eukprot:COSAG06_NODE_5765_length_3284_cov_14.119623_2_plen_193_part_00